MDKLNYLKTLLDAGLVATAPKTLDPNLEELVFFEVVPDDLLDLRRDRLPTAEWYLILPQRPGSEESSTLADLGITPIVAEIDLARKTLGAP